MTKKSLNILLWISFISGCIVFLIFPKDKNLQNFIICFLSSAMYTFVLGVGNGILNDGLNRKYSWVNDTKTRAILGIIGTIVVNFILVYLCNYINFVLIQKVASASTFFSSKYGFVNWLYINFALLISTFLHAKSFVEELKKTSRKEVVEQKIIAKSANAQFESLKNQLDPHFLFNSLNVLSSLIEENPNQAQKFTASMSKIYRYVLEQKDKELVSIEEEIEFAKIYAELLKTRFEDSVDFRFDISINPKQFVVPLSLQLLLENCIKHNHATSTNPLIIKIFVKDNFLCIENNLQTRDAFGDREGIGLTNIVQRYALISKEHVFIEKSEDYFKVKIPIITEIIKSINMENLDQTKESIAYKRAMKKVKEIKGFYVNLMSYCIVISFLIIINLITFSQHLWFIYPMLGWGIGLFAHGMSVFAIGNSWEKRKIKELMDRDSL